MKAGDLVRVSVWNRPDEPDYCLGLLICYHKWEKVATVLINGEIERIKSCYVTKAGRKDYYIINA